MSEQIKREPVRYLVKEKSLVGNTMHEAGDIALYDGLPAENLEPQCDEGRARYQEYLKSNEDRVKALVANNGPITGGGIADPTAFMAAFQKELAEQNQRQADMMAAAIAHGIKTGMAELLAAQGIAPAPAALVAEPEKAADTEAKPAGKPGK